MDGHTGNRWLSLSRRRLLAGRFSVVLLFPTLQRLTPTLKAGHRSTVSSAALALVGVAVPRSFQRFGAHRQLC